MLNGVDYDLWNPEIDPLIPVQYGSDRFDGKYANKWALRDRFLITDSFKPAGRVDRTAGPPEGRRADP